jgi:succinate dehydrogenase / fumarate reductase membrane anchor subunit
MLPAQKTGFKLWFWQRLTAFILVLGIFVHFAVTHLIGEPLSFGNVNERTQHLFWVIFDSILLITALIHGFGGLWSIYLDYNPKGTFRKFLGWVVVFLVIIFTVYGLIALKALSA